MATPFEIPQHRYRYPQGDSLPLAPPEKRLRKRLCRVELIIPDEILFPVAMAR